MRELTAYFLTLRAYGTWLHGDERGSTDRAHNGYEQPFLQPQKRYQEAMRRSMTSEPLKFNRAQRECLRQTIEEVARYREWHLPGVAVRTNHVHIVVGADVCPEKVMADFKAYGTRNLRRGLIARSQNVWSEHGSTVYLFGTEAYENALDYILEQQGESLDDVD